MRPYRARADYAGLVFYPASPRAVTSNVVGALTSRAAGQIAMVGLFVDADDAVIADALVAAAERCSCTVRNRPNAWPSCARGLASRCGRRCPSPAPAMSHAPQPMLGGGLDLVRRQDPQRRVLPGGMGLAFDWSLLAGYRGALPWGLAGGAG